MSNSQPARNNKPKSSSSNQRQDGSSLLDQVDFIGDEDDIDIQSHAPVSLFDEAIGHIEDIMVEDAFQELQNSFFSNYSHLFSESEENQLEYTNIHAEYVATLERHLETELSQRIEDFSMERFAHELTERKDQLEGEVFEMLFTITDFVAFKEAMLDYKRAATGEAVDVSMDLVVVPLTPRDAEMTSPSASLSLRGTGSTNKKPR
ncbi:hypothetical protein BOX15_Mlig007429g2 [Macrostomum lignano]|uniref:Uncharacterized protein n=3 Tax=Macrostomum lignano TaxID=282301 RepID=A0A267FQR6_9PLAT|nr:hypothetical protein BOX15_Mlig007429g1 [Macrostomum lignano]PAA76148.1 hypothetical protein BOX15_Mlig007429g3 [Macrostomum lignano]PAA93160.1 hypothetical protein BOX15_Mlig007429g2 [Macrostomum lignano]